MTDTQTAPAARTRAPREAAPPAEGETAAPAKTSKAKGFTAELVRGENYAVRHDGKTYRFKRNVAVNDLPESLRDVLKDAADESTITDGDGEQETLRRPKFKLS